MALKKVFVASFIIPFIAKLRKELFLRNKTKEKLKKKLSMDLGLAESVFVLVLHKTDMISLPKLVSSAPLCILDIFSFPKSSHSDSNWFDSFIFALALAMAWSPAEGPGLGLLSGINLNAWHELYCRE